MSFEVKDSGRRQEYPSGMVRDVTDGKVNHALVYDGPMLLRWAAHLTKGQAKYGRANWKLANSVEEMERFRDSAARHFHQWMAGETDEDHAAAVYYNLCAYEFVKGRLAVDKAPDPPQGCAGCTDSRCGEGRLTRTPDPIQAIWETVPYDDRPDGVM